MTERNIIFTDLDDTIFSTMRKQKESKTSDFTIGSVNKKGLPSGLLNPVQQEFFKRLSTIGHIIPVTARLGDALSRVTLFNEDCDAIWCHGALIRYNGEIDVEWKNRSVEILKNASYYFEKAIEELEEKSFSKELKITCSKYEELNGLPLQVLIRNHDDTELNKNLIEEILASIDLEGLYFHKQRNYVALLAKGISKKEAVNYLINKENFKMVIGCGDSDVDFHFMSLCDYTVIPKDSLLMEKIKEKI